VAKVGGADLEGKGQEGQADLMEDLITQLILLVEQKCTFLEDKMGKIILMMFTFLI
jgi:hypothetical protein